MGWLFIPGATRQDIIDRITAFEDSDGGTWEFLKHCTRGNVLWSVVRWTDKTNGNVVKDIITCHLLDSTYESTSRGKQKYWGYKSMCESMNPFYYTCPMSYLKSTEVVCQEWRDQVKLYHRKHKVGERLMLSGCKVPHLDVVSSKPLIGQYGGQHYRVPRDCVTEVCKQAEA